MRFVHIFMICSWLAFTCFYFVPYLNTYFLFHKVLLTEFSSSQELLELGEAVGTQSRGLPQEHISMLPISKYKCGFFSRKRSRHERWVDSLFLLHPSTGIRNSHFRILEKISFINFVLWKKKTWKNEEKCPPKLIAYRTELMCGSLEAS